MTDTRELLRGLLGPAGVELSCEQCFEQLDRYVESELEHGAARAEQLIPGMRAHLDGCAACREDHLSLRAMVASEAQGSGS
jgi:anti-sigma factor RsiW